MKNIGNGKIIIVALGIIILGAIYTVASDDESRINFAHPVHLKMKLPCTDCHKEILEDSALFKTHPKMAQCQSCHDLKEKNSCEKCHNTPRIKGKPGKRRRRTNFLHSDHKNRMSDCGLCHKNIDEKPHKAGSHQVCGKCHKQDMVNLKCARCHRKMNWEGVASSKTFKHKDGFFKDHGKFAGKTSRTCSQCHSQNYCSECHSGRAGIKPSLKYPEKVSRNFMHRGDWLTLHRVEAGSGRLTCLKCHGENDCSSCHKRSKVSPAADKVFFGHPDGWLSKASANFHGDKARREIVSCAACHKGGGPGDCTTCHKATGKLNPHPPGFTGGQLDKNSRMCAKCHDK